MNLDNMKNVFAGLLRFVIYIWGKIKNANYVFFKKVNKVYKKTISMKKNA